MHISPPTQIVKPPECFKKLSNMFQLHRDLVLKDPNYHVPFPTYKRTPIGDFITKMIGFKVKIGELLTQERMSAAFRALDVSEYLRRERSCNVLPPATVMQKYFGSRNSHVPVEINATLPTMPMGWPDGVGVYRKVLP